MPPPSTTLSTIQHRLSVYRHYFLSWAAENAETIHLVAGLSIFLMKMLSITKPCLPAAMREEVWYPLMALAALELALRTRLGWRSTVVFAVGHMAVLWAALRLGGGLCAERSLNGDWQWDGEAHGERINS
jgi:hypothetical protein